MTRAEKSLLAIAVTIVAAAPAALAATPENGTVSSASPRAEWTGESGGYGITAANILVNAAGERMICEAPACDTYTLDVAEAGHTLTISVTSEQSSITQVEVEKPDGTWVMEYGTEAEGEEPNFTTMMKFSKAPKGTWIVRTQSNNAGPDDPYKAFAQLAVPGAVAPPPTGSSAPPPSAPAPSSPGPAPAPNFSVKGAKGSAKKLNRKRSLVVSVSSDQTVTDVRAVLKRGSSVVGKGSLAQLNGTGKLKLKLSKKLKRGTYNLGVTARSSSGTVVGASAKVSVKR